VTSRWRLLTYNDYLTVYGVENVTSGASSDIRKATRTAQAMVKVYLCYPGMLQPSYLKIVALGIL